MSTRIQALKGFQDVLPADSWKWQAVESAAREIARRYRFLEIRTPELENTALFHRGVGETSDIVRKETYTFADRDGESITLRPEGTAGVVRAVLEAALLNDAGSRLKVFYLCKNFRHERPQKGRLRQHSQFGVEAFGVADPAQDVECIQLQLDFYRYVGLKDVSLRVNSLGDRESKQRYREALLRFLTPKRTQLSEDSQRRLETNPLRILDSKDPRDRDAIIGSPAAIDSLTDASRSHFESVKSLLDDLKVNYTIDGSLVRGFDYYTDTLWEVTAGGLGAQNAVGGGGRYDNLVENLGGKPTPGVGFGSGIERLLIALESQKVQLARSQERLIWIVWMGDAAKRAAILLARDLRIAGLAVDLDLTGRKIKNQFAMADKSGATEAIVIGDAELEKGEFVVKTLSSGQQHAVPRDRVVDFMAGSPA